MAYQSFSEYRGSEQFKIDQANIKKREEIEKNREEAYRDTGGLPANLR